MGRAPADLSMLNLVDRAEWGEGRGGEETSDFFVLGKEEKKSSFPASSPPLSQHRQETKGEDQTKQPAESARLKLNPAGYKGRTHAAFFWKNAIKFSFKKAS